MFLKIKGSYGSSRQCKRHLWHGARYLTVIVRGRAGYELIYISDQRGRRPSWLLSAHIRQVRQE